MSLCNSEKGGLHLYCGQTAHLECFFIAISDAEGNWVCSTADTKAPTHTHPPMTGRDESNIHTTQLKPTDSARRVASYRRVSSS